MSWTIERRLTSCSDYESPQSCGDGYCVYPSDVCDGTVECLNGNDEMHCSKSTRL